MKITTKNIRILGALALLALANAAVTPRYLPPGDFPAYIGGVSMMAQCTYQPLGWPLVFWVFFSEANDPTPTKTSYEGV